MKQPTPAERRAAWDAKHGLGVKPRKRAALLVADAHTQDKAPSGPVAGYAATTQDVESLDAWLVANGVRRAVH